MDIQPARAHFVACKLSSPGETSSTVRDIERKMNELVPNTPQHYFFLDDRLDLAFGIGLYVMPIETGLKAVGAFDTKVDEIVAFSINVLRAIERNLNLEN